MGWDASRGGSRVDQIPFRSINAKTRVISGTSTYLVIDTMYEIIYPIREHAQRNVQEPAVR